MPVYLVRHAKAGNRSAWSGPDEERPLSKAGVAQVKAMTAWLAGQTVTRVLSSPSLRCVQLRMTGMTGPSRTSAISLSVATYYGSTMIEAP